MLCLWKRGVITALGAGFATAAFASNTIVFGGSGSSAMFSAFKSAALTQATAAVGTNSYQGANAGFSHDGSNPEDRGNLWVVWTGDFTADANNRQIWFYLSIDSVAGVRGFFNRAYLRPNGASPSAMPAPASGIVMPQDVYDTINQAVFNAGMTDVTAADAKVAMTETLGRGYSASNKIQGLGSTAGALSTVTPIDFSLGARSFKTVAIGAAPIVFFVNKSNAGVGHFGNPDFDNINLYEASGFLSGNFNRTRQMLAQANVPEVPVTTFIREPLSGTYVTTNACVPLSVGYNQEDNIAGNPANETTPAYDLANPTAALTAGGRVRAIGTGALVNAVNVTPDSLGYAFWSTGNFASAGNTKYLTLDGCEPLLDSYQGGSYPSGASVTFKNLRNGSYRAWSILRSIVEPNPSTDLQNYFAFATATSSGGNFVAKNDLQVFRAHYSTKDIRVVHNGNIAGFGESGGDAGGGVFSINADQDFFDDTGLELVEFRQTRRLPIPVATPFDH